MSEFFNAITDEQREFIARQPVFFVATATEGGRIDVSPRGMDGFRVLAPNLVGFLDKDGSDIEAQADGRFTIMICALDQASLVLSLHGRGRAISPKDDEWDFASRPFMTQPEDGRIVMVAVESVHESADWEGPSIRLGEDALQHKSSHVHVDSNWVPAVLNFWLNEVGPGGWFDSSDEEDVRLTHLFRALWEAQREKPADMFLADADTALAALILFDQFPRNMFRGQARAFATDPLALEIARGALERGFDDEFVEGARAFFYLPFMHSENLTDQERCVALFSRPGYELNLKFAIAHRDIIARFGRFPHRNAVLGRETLPEEEEAVAEGSAW